MYEVKVVELVYGLFSNNTYYQTFYLNWTPTNPNLADKPTACH